MIRECARSCKFYPKLRLASGFFAYEKYKNGNSARRTVLQRYILPSITQNGSDNFSSGRHFLRNGWSYGREILYDNLEDQSSMTYFKTVFILVALSALRYLSLTNSIAIAHTAQLWWYMYLQFTGYFWLVGWFLGLTSLSDLSAISWLGAGDNQSEILVARVIFGKYLWSLWPTWPCWVIWYLGQEKGSTLREGADIMYNFLPIPFHEFWNNKHTESIAKAKHVSHWPNKFKSATNI